MARHKNKQWSLPEGQVKTWEQAGIALLMDIRDELQQLNRLLNCHRVPAGMDAMVETARTVKRLDKRMQKKRPLR